MNKSVKIRPIIHKEYGGLIYIINTLCIEQSIHRQLCHILLLKITANSTLFVKYQKHIHNLYDITATRCKKRTKQGTSTR